MGEELPEDEAPTTPAPKRAAAEARAGSRRPLRPVTILALGSVLTGIMLAIVMTVGQPDMLTWRGVGISFGLGSLGGLIMFAPIAAGDACRQWLARLLDRRAVAVHWYVSLLGAIALAYLVASFLRRRFDAITALAAAVVFAVALIKMLLAIVYDEGDRRGS